MDLARSVHGLEVVLFHVVDDVLAKRHRLHIRGAVVEARPDAGFDDLLKPFGESSKWRVSPSKQLLVTSKSISSVPKNVWSTRSCALSSARCPEGCSG